MNYRSLTDLKRALYDNVHRIPDDVDVIVGIPRSGLLAANLLALYLNRPLADLEGIVDGRCLAAGERLDVLQTDEVLPHARRILVVDDSSLSGKALSKARSIIAGCPELYEKAVFLAVFGTKGEMEQADIVLEVCPVPRVFEWNIFHHAVLKTACVDIDGVLCRDPEDFENDDGRRYAEFISGVRPRIVPGVTVGNLVTSRLEKYRPETIAWLDRHGIAYKNLWMLGLDSARRRKMLAPHAKFKAEIYKKTKANLFIESSVWQTKEIVRLTGKSVYCTDDGSMYGRFAMGRPEPSHGYAPVSFGVFLKMRAAYYEEARWSALRKALANADRRGGIRELSQAVVRDPLSLVHRPTLGAIRKLLFRS